MALAVILNERIIGSAAYREALMYQNSLRDKGLGISANTSQSESTFYFSSAVK